MNFDRYWLGYGMDGALQMAGIAVALGVVAYGVCFLLGRREGAREGVLIAWSWLAASLLSGFADIWDLIYFNVVPIHSLQLLQLKLALVHDPNSIGLRVLFELLGATVGVAIGWALFSAGYHRRLRSRP
jgi:hypothetical protein